MLWLALFLPRLPLDAQPAAPPPSVVVERERIVAVDDAAGAAGIAPGMRLASAHARLPGLRVWPRAPEREAAALRQLACWAGAFTSEVSLAPPATVLLEIGGSLRLFGGVDSLFPRIVRAAAAQGFAVQAALAPTPLAAQWLAQTGDDRPCTQPGQLTQRLGPLPLALLLPTQAAQLAAFGAHTLSDALRLPRAGLSRRLGPAFAADVARALAELPDPRPRFVFPERFAERLELPARSESAGALAFAARRLLAALCGWLAARAAGIRSCVLELHCERGSTAAATLRLPLCFAEATRDPLRIARVLDERLARLELPAPVEALRLVADAPEALSGRAGELFAAAAGDCGAARGASSGAIAELVERLQARLGEDQVYRLACVSEHRPENATRRLAGAGLDAAAPPREERSATLAAADAANGALPRPLWLLPAPQPLPEQDGRPQRGGPLRLLAGPERIESGWWDEGEPVALGDVRRDYFVAVSPRCQWLWIFRSEAGWFLHGLFA